jgi:hypothetical protein
LASRFNSHAKALWSIDPATVRTATKGKVFLMARPARDVAKGRISLPAQERPLAPDASPYGGATYTVDFDNRSRF